MRSPHVPGRRAPTTEPTAARDRDCPAARSDGPTRRLASANGTRQSTPITSAPAAPIRPSNSEVPTPKWIRGTPVIASACNTRAEYGCAYRAVVVGTEAAGPRVEQLHDRSASGDLRPQKDRGEVGEPGAQRVPQGRLADHQRLGRRVVAAWSALDQIAGQGERSAREADQRNLRRAAAISPTASVTYQRSAGSIGCNCSRSAARPDRTSDHRAAAGDDVEVDACRLERQHDVGVENGGIDTVTTYRLQGDLGDQLRAACSSPACRCPPGWPDTPAANARPVA